MWLLELACFIFDFVKIYLVIFIYVYVIVNE